jgi:hypothetical protein
MIVSLSIYLIVFFKGNVFIVAYIFLIVRIWTSDRPFIKGDKEDKFILLFAKRLSGAQRKKLVRERKMKEGTGW